MDLPCSFYERPFLKISDKLMHFANGEMHFKIKKPFASANGFSYGVLEIGPEWGAFRLVPVKIRLSHVKRRLTLVDFLLLHVNCDLVHVKPDLTLE